MTTLAESLILTLTVGAASATATPEQRAELHDRLREILPRYRVFEVDETAVHAVITDVMGADWAPTGTYAEQIDALRGDDG